MLNFAEADKYKPGPWALSLDAITSPEQALAELAKEAEHSTFVATALDADEKGMMWCAREFRRIQLIALKFAV